MRIIFVIIANMTYEFPDPPDPPDPPGPNGSRPVDSDEPDPPGEPDLNNPPYSNNITDAGIPVTSDEEGRRVNDAVNKTFSIHEEDLDLFKNGIDDDDDE